MRDCAIALGADRRARACSCAQVMRRRAGRAELLAGHEDHVRRVGEPRDGVAVEQVARTASRRRRRSSTPPRVGRRPPRHGDHAPARRSRARAQPCARASGPSCRRRRARRCRPDTRASAAVVSPRGAESSVVELGFGHSGSTDRLGGRALGVSPDARDHRVEPHLATGKTDAFHHLMHEIARDRERRGRRLVVDGREENGKKRRHGRRLADVELGVEMQLAIAEFGKQLDRASGTRARRTGRDRTRGSAAGRARASWSNRPAPASFPRGSSREIATARARC